MQRSRLKRQASDGSESLEAEFKKVRISKSAGELRLEKDVTECRDLVAAGICTFEQQALTLHIRFSADLGCAAAPYGGLLQQQRGGSAPLSYTLLVPKLYSHEAPIMRCNDAYDAASCRSFLTTAGTVCSHPLDSKQSWSSIHTLRDIVLGLLSKLREHLGLGVLSDAAMVQ